MPLSKIIAKSNLKRAIKQTADARRTNGGKADELFQNAYKSYSAVIGGDPHIADALYNWGSALFYQALTKSGEEAQKLFRSAGEKFSACLVINPGVTSAAIDWGVALMEQARASGFAPSHCLYDEAREKFLLAEEMLNGSASYNLACVHSLRNEHEECLKFLNAAKEHGNLPTPGQIVNDADLAGIRNTLWFQAFLESLESPQPKIQSETAEATAEAETAAGE